MILNEPLNVCLIGGKVFFLTNKGESVAILADKCKKECCIEKKRRRTGLVTTVYIMRI